MFDKALSKKSTLKILIPTDLSSKPIAISKILKILNKKFIIDVIVIHIIDSFFENLFQNTKHEKKLHQLLLKWGQKLPKELKHPNFIVGRGNTTKEIINASKKYKSDLILFEDKDKYFRKHEMGTIRGQILRYGNVSVWTAKSIEFKKILCCVDGSDYSASAIKSSIKLATDFNCTLTILYVLPKLDFNPSGLDRHIVYKFNKEFREKWIHYIDTFLNKFNFKKLKRVERIYRRGSPSEIILEVADEEKFDLIVMGAKGHNLLYDFFVGSTVEKVIPFSSCSTLVIR